MYKERDKNDANHDLKRYVCTSARKRGIREKLPEDGMMCGQDECWGQRPAHAHIGYKRHLGALNHLRKKQKP